MVKENGVVVLDGTLVKANQVSSAKHYSIPATEKALQVLKSEMTANIVLLAAANAIGHIVSKTSLEESIKTTVSPRFVELNLKAMELGFGLAKKAGV